MTALTVGDSAKKPDGPAAVKRRNRYLSGILSPRGLTGSVLVLVVVAAGLIGPLVLGSPYTQSNNALAAPGGSHWLGTDEVGRDILTRLVSGIRVDLSLVLVAVPIAALAGTALGVLSAFNKRLNLPIQGVLDILLGFPGVILGVIIGIAMAPGWGAIMVAIVLGAVPTFGRQARISTLAVLGLDFVPAARTFGSSTRKIMVRHVAPNIVDSILVRAAVVASNAILVEGGLSVIGLGIQPPQPSLGAMISTGSKYLESAPAYALVPVGVVFVISLGFTLIADALNAAVVR